MPHVSSFGRRLATIAGAVAVVAATSAAISTPVVHAAACTLVRPYPLATVLDDKAWANAHGYIGPMESTDAGISEFALTLSAQQADQLQESIDGGCVPHLRFSTRGTVQSLGTGTSSFVGVVTAAVAGTAMGPINVAGTYPLSASCVDITCQENLVHDLDLRFAAGGVSAGAMITVSSTSLAAAAVTVADQFHQAHADFSVRYPVLRIPIP